jgi:hypothetical protein
MGSNYPQVYDTLYIDLSSVAVIDVVLDTTDVATINKVLGRAGGGTVLPLTAYTVQNQKLTPDSTTKTTLVSSYKLFTYTSTDKVEIVYVPWDKDTFFHVLDLSQSPDQQISSLYLASGATTFQTVKHNTTLNVNTSVYNGDTNDNAFVKYTLYDSDRILFQVCNCVWIDTQNGSLVLSNKSGLLVYERQSGSAPTPVFIPRVNYDGTSYKAPVQSTPSLSFTVWNLVVNDYLVLYYALDKKTMVLVLNRNQNASNYGVINAVRVMSNGSIDNGSSDLNILLTSNVPTIDKKTGQNNKDTDDDKDKDKKDKDKGKDKKDKDKFDWKKYYDDGDWKKYDDDDDDSNPLSDYYSSVLFFNTLGSGSTSFTSTSYVPGTCPKCPYCQQGCAGVCSYCGGNGGSGTTLHRDNQIVSMVEDTSSGLKDLLLKTEGNIKDLLQDTGSGIKEVLKDTGSGMKDLIQDTGSTIKDSLHFTPVDVKSPSTTTGGPTIAPSSSPSPSPSPSPLSNVEDRTKIRFNVPPTVGNDPYSYFGALSKETDGKQQEVMPMAANLSAFQR